MNLDMYLRTHVAAKIRPLYIKSKCEHCGSIDDLHLHHVKPFVKMVDKVLNKLNLELKDSEDYTEQERYLIVSCVLSEHLNGEYLTLCPQCHHNVHEGNKKRRASLTDEQKLRLKQIRLEQKEKLKQQQLTNTINNYLNKKLKSSDIKSLTKELKWYQSNGKKNLTINETIDKLTSLNYNVDIKVIRKVKEFIITK